MIAPGFCAGILSWLPLAKAFDGGTFWMPKQASTLAPKIDGLFYIITWICTVFFILIVACMVLFIVLYRARPGHKEQPSPSHNTILEITWSVIPLLLILVIFWYSFVDYMDLEQPPDNSIQVTVHGQKWSWDFQYANGAHDGTLYAPVGKPVELVMTSDDVLHCLYIPDFRTKQDVVPGRYSYIWFQANEPGEHQIYCAEYCGTKHSYMWSKVEVVSQEDYDKKLVELGDIVGHSKTPEEAGEKLYKARGCVQCHSIDGVKGTGPTFKGIWGSTVDLEGGTQVTVDDNYVHQSVLDPPSQVVKGFTPVMPSFQGKLKEKEIEAIISYIKTLK